MRWRRRAPAPELLGTVTLPSGELVLLDAGLLQFWSGDRAPLLEEDDEEPDLVRAANEAQDLEVVGPDARAVAGLLDLAAVKGRWAFDAMDGGALVTERVAALAQEHGLRAEVRPVERVPHRRRVQLLLDDDPDGVEVPYLAGWAVAVRLPPSREPLRVLGTRMDPEGPDAERWRSVWLELGPGEPVSSSEAGLVTVDEARLLFADAAALSSWRLGLGDDGLVDLAVWGRDVDAAVAGLDARPLPEGEGVVGWEDLPLDRAAALLEELDRRREDPEVRFMTDLRPHDDAFRLLAQVRQTPTASGTLDVGGATMTGFHTSWGDGAFEVLLDRDAAGRPCRLRVELGAEDVVQRMRRVEELWSGPLSAQALVSAAVARDGAPVGWLHREEPDHEQDSGWRVFSGEESQEYLDDADNVVLVPLRDLVADEPQLEPLLAHPPRVAFERTADGAFAPCAPPPEEG